MMLQCGRETMLDDLARNKAEIDQLWDDARDWLDTTPA